MALPNGLLEAVKVYLDITWEDEQGDIKLTGIIERGIKRIDEICGSVQNYALEEPPRELLFEYVRYARSNALDEFFVNYLPEINTLFYRKEAAKFDKEQDEGSLL